MAVISREYKLGDESLEIAIPVRSADLCDAVGTLSVQGDVECPEPPSYEPVGANETSLTIDPQSVDRELATKLAGAKVKLNVQGAEHIGTLMGIQEYTEAYKDIVVERYRVSIRKEDGTFLSIPSTEVVSVEFLEDQIKSEIDKALQRSFSHIKPNSSFIKLKIVPKHGATTCTVTYAIPAASWKVRYHLYIEGKEWSLNQQAIVDNDTDDDWRDSLISVVSGEPITFATDLAEIRRPQRSKVNVVASHAQGAVDMETEIPGIVFPCMDMDESVNIPSRAMMTKSVARSASLGRGGMESMSFSAGASQSLGAEAEYRESGDFAVFDSPTPVTILSERSAIIPLATSSLGEGQTLLLFNPNKDQRRPFRALRFKNTTGQSFGKGVCEIIQDGDLQGKAVLQGAKADEEVNLVYAKETGVNVFSDSKGSQQELVGIQISKGVVVWSRRSECATDYKVENLKDEEFKFEIEHALRISDATVEVFSIDEVGVADGEKAMSVPFVKTPSGIRVSVPLPPKGKGKIVVRVSEKGDSEQKVHLNDSAAASRYIFQQFINVQNPIAAITGNQQVQALIAIQEKIDAKNQEINDANARTEEIDEDQDRISGLIDKFSSTDAAKYQSQLAKNEEERETLVKTTKPALVAAMRELEDQRNKMAKDFTLNWTA
jgi:hypothetical protein